uniref:Uncharacterized protein n=1 Tax=Globisporangium ultimum (strain ATCC 200006 / CBS 805.95 / DAOM BR144) TaxID=431595 RepID=K3WH58_GLOUD
MQDEDDLDGIAQDENGDDNEYGVQNPQQDLQDDPFSEDPTAGANPLSEYEPFQHEDGPQQPLHESAFSDEKQDQQGQPDDERRLTEAAEQDEYAELEGIDLSSPFHIDFADKSTLVRLVDWAYDRTAFFSRFQDGFVHAEELSRLFGFALNPKDEDLEPESYVLLDAAADKMRREQGLLEDDLIVPRGFIGRGMPLRVLQALAQQMYAHHTTQRRLEAAAPPYARASDL